MVFRSSQTGLCSVHEHTDHIPALPEGDGQHTSQSGVHVSPGHLTLPHCPPQTCKRRARSGSDWQNEGLLAVLWPHWPWLPVVCVRHVATTPTPQIWEGSQAEERTKRLEHKTETLRGNLQKKIHWHQIQQSDTEERTIKLEHNTDTLRFRYNRYSPVHIAYSLQNIALRVTWTIQLLYHYLLLYINQSSVTIIFQSN